MNWRSIQCFVLFCWVAAYDSTTTSVSVDVPSSAVDAYYIAFMQTIICLLILLLVMCLVLIGSRRRLSQRSDVQNEATIAVLLRDTDVPYRHLAESSDGIWKGRETLVNHLSREDLQTVLLKAMALLCRETHDDLASLVTLCSVSHVWRQALRNCHRQNRDAFGRATDSTWNCRRATLKARLHATGRVCGVACMYDSIDKIYIICEHSNTIAVFHAGPPYEQLRGILVSGLQQPTDLVACSTNRLLYLSDHAASCVWQVTTGGKIDYRFPMSKTQTRPDWTPTRRKTDGVYPVSLSVRFGRLAVVETSRVSIYDTHDDIVNEIRFSNSVTLHHAVESDHHSCLVALSDTDVIHSAVREMKRNGSGEWISVREWNLRNSVPPRPLYMAWDHSSNFYVVVHDSHIVLVLNSALTEVRSICLRKRSQPNRLTFLDRRRLSFLVGSGLEVDLYNG